MTAQAQDVSLLPYSPLTLGELNDRRQDAHDRAAFAARDWVESEHPEIALDHVHHYATEANKWGLAGQKRVAR